MRINSDKLNTIIQALRIDLGAGFVATDIWTTTDAMSLVNSDDHNSYPKAVALLNEVTRKLDATLKGSEYPGLGNYYFVNLVNNQLVVVLSISTYQQFILVDLSKTTMGILMSVALPNLLSSLAEAEITEGLVEAKTEAAATVSPAETDATEKPRKQSAIRSFLDKFNKGMHYADNDGSVNVKRSTNHPGW